jgi:dihydroxycyclohexadiene carboxylate dehydrogenase
MLRQRRGAIVNIGSAATRGIYRVPYAAAKGGIHAITAALAMELGATGVRINCVSPGGVENPGRLIPRNPNPPSEAEKAWRQEVIAQTRRDTPMGRYGSADEIAAAVCFLASDDASYMTGQVLWLAGGGIG